MSNDRYTLIPFVKIQPGMIIAYQLLDPRPVVEYERKNVFHSNTEQAQPYTGLLTPTSKKKLIKAINLLVAISQPKRAIHFDSKKEFTFRVNFITLTLPAAQGTVQDKQLKQSALKQWLEYWKDKLPGFSYVWRAERQGNGNLHFHLITNRYIHFKDLRDSWNKRLEPFGFINAFEKANGHRYPNSTDVHAVKAIRNLGAYIAKYMSKTSESPDTIQGKVWDCSTNLKQKDQCAFPMSAADLDSFDRIFTSMPYDSFNTDFCGGVRMTEKEMRKLFPANWVKEYSSYLSRIRG